MRYSEHVHTHAGGGAEREGEGEKPKETACRVLNGGLDPTTPRPRPQWNQESVAQLTMTPRHPTLIFQLT